MIADPHSSPRAPETGPGMRSPESTLDGPVIEAERCGRVVSVVVPCRNERAHIGTFLASVLSQETPGFSVEVIIADGMSDDGTRDEILCSAGGDPRVRIVDNLHRTTPHGLNEAIREARGEIILRMDVHTEYAPDYISQCVRVLEETGADNVGGPWQAGGRTYRQRAIALAFQSPFCSGGAGSHDVNFEGAVDSVYLGCWRREIFGRVGLFDAELVRNQDDEWNLRLIRQGGRIWQSPKIRSVYQPRDSISALFRQYMQYGYWKVSVIRKHQRPASPRHLVPGAFVGVLGVLAVLSPFHRVAAELLAGALGTWAAAALLSSLRAAGGKPDGWACLPFLPLVFAAYHFGYGIGFLRGVLDFLVLRRGPRPSFSTLTRGRSEPAS